MSLRRRLAALLAPPHCALCGAPGQWLDEPWGLDLCAHCEAACPRAPAEPDPAVFCLFRYEDPVDLMIQQLKFHHSLVHARVLGTLLARALRDSGRPLPECLLPLPLHAERFRERGFCQTTAIARHLSRRLPARTGSRLPLCTGLLRRARATRAQSGLSAAARAANLAGAFTVDPHWRGPLPRHLALLDDVLTTGHTTAAAAQALRQAGVEKVEIWCCARALRRDQDRDRV